MTKYFVSHTLSSILLGVESSGSEDHSTSFVTEPGETNATFPPKKKKKKRKKRKRGKVKQQPEKEACSNNEAVMSQLVAVRQQSRLSLHKGQNLSLWDVSAQTLLNITLTFLRHVPEVIMN